MTREAGTGEAPAGRRELWRQDDNGNRFVIARFDTAEAAEAEQRRFEALGHNVRGG
jgi:hypothetical protein